MTHLNDTEKELILIPLPLKTKSYSPVPHSDFIEVIQNKLLEQGYTITNKRYWFNQTMTQVVGRYSVDYKDSDMEFAVGFKNSYDKSMSAGIAIGGQIIVCRNGMVKGDYTIKRKHTGTIKDEIMDFTDESLAKSAERFEYLCGVKNKLKETILNKSTTNELIGKMFMEEEILRSEQLGIVKREFLSKEPTFDYGVDHDSAWNLYSICSYAIDQKTTPNLYINQHGKLLGTFEELIGCKYEDSFELVDDITN